MANTKESQNDNAQTKILFLTNAEVVSTPKWEMLTKFDPGFPKSVLYFKDFPINQELTISVNRLMEPEYKIQTMGLFIRPDGTLWIKGMHNMPFYVVSGRGFLPGEQATFRIQTQGGIFSHEVSLVPNPIKVEKPQQDFAAEAVLSILSPAYYQITLKGIHKGEEVKMKSISGNERLNRTFKYGEVAIMYAPDVMGKRGGVGLIIFELQNGKTVEMQLPWGDQMFEYLKGDKVFEVFNNSKRILL